VLVTRSAYTLSTWKAPMLRIDTTWHLLKRTLASQRTARANAAEAILVLGRRREEKNAVDDYLLAHRGSSLEKTKR
jgi:hypothetical protein